MRGHRGRLLIAGAAPPGESEPVTVRWGVTVRRRAWPHRARTVQTCALRRTRDRKAPRRERRSATVRGRRCGSTAPGKRLTQVRFGHRRGEECRAEAEAGGRAEGARGNRSETGRRNETGRVGTGPGLVASRRNGNGRFRARRLGGGRDVQRAERFTTLAPRRGRATAAPDPAPDVSASRPAGPSRPQVVGPDPHQFMSSSRAGRRSLRRRRRQARARCRGRRRAASPRPRQRSPREAR